MAKAAFPNGTAIGPARARDLASWIAEQPGSLALTVLGILLTVFWKLFRAWEILSFVRELRALGGALCRRCPCCAWCCSCRCCSRRSVLSRNERKWILFVWDHEEHVRHDAAVKQAWAWWNALSVALRNPRIGAARTWTDWNVWGGRLRVHPWHRERKARKGPGTGAGE